MSNKERKSMIEPWVKGHEPQSYSSGSVCSMWGEICCLCCWETRRLRKAMHRLSSAEPSGAVSFGGVQCQRVYKLIRRKTAWTEGKKPFKHHKWLEGLLTLKNGVFCSPRQKTKSAEAKSTNQILVLKVGSDDESILKRYTSHHNSSYI